MKTRPRMIKRTPPTFAARTTPLLRFSPTAWAKLLFLREAGETEIGGFGISRRDALLDVNDLVLIPQTTTAVSVEFDDLAVATFFEEQVGHGRQPEEFARIWVHTHPGDCPLPSATDEATFARVFGACDWAVMLILARGGASSCRLAWNVGPQGAMEIPVTVDYSQSFTGSDQAAWQAEYDRCVQPHDAWSVEFDFWPCPSRPPFVRRPQPGIRSQPSPPSGNPLHVD